MLMEDAKLATVLKPVYIASYYKASQIPSTRTQKKHLCRHTKESADAGSCAFAGELSVREEKERERNATQKGLQAAWGDSEHFRIHQSIYNVEYLL